MTDDYIGEDLAKIDSIFAIYIFSSSNTFGTKYTIMDMQNFIEVNLGIREEKIFNPFRIVYIDVEVSRVSVKIIIKDKLYILSTYIPRI